MLLRLLGQLSSGPRLVFDQSNDRINAAISPFAGLDRPRDTMGAAANG